jgi:hypothetical protein
MQISGKYIENLLVNMLLTFNKNNFREGTLPFFFTWE